MTKREVAIVHFNTPELTEACIMSVRKHGGMDYHITVFDNSDQRPFTANMEGVTVIDNTKGQVIDFNKELAKYLVGSALLWICEDGCRLRLCCFEGSTHSLLGWAVATVVWVFHTHTYGGIVFLAVAEVNLIRTRELLRNRIEGGGVFDKSHIVGIGLQCKRLCRFAR